MGFKKLFASGCPANIKNILFVLIFFNRDHLFLKYFQKEQFTIHKCFAIPICAGALEAKNLNFKQYLVS